MSSSPFEIFRRNLKPLMVALTLLALLSFVVLPVVQSSMARNMGNTGDEVVASFGDVELTRNRIDYFTRTHQSTLRFLRDLGAATIQRGGQPRTAGFFANPQTGEVMQVGISPQPSGELSLLVMAYADAAREAGFELDDSAVDSWITRYTDNQFNDRDIDAMLMQATQNQMARQHLREHLRNHLLANLYVRRGDVTLVNSNRELKTPLQQWEAFLKLRQSATIDACGLNVSEYVDATDPNPPEGKIREVYEDGKDRDPSPSSDEPGFHRRYAAGFETLVANYDAFLKRETDKLSEEQLRAEYEKQKRGGAFELPREDTLDLGLDDLMSDATKDADTVADSADDKAAMKSEDGDATDADTPTQAGGSEGATDAKADPSEAKANDGADQEPAGNEEAMKESGSGDESTEPAGESKEVEEVSEPATEDEKPTDDAEKPSGDAEKPSGDAEKPKADGKTPGENEAASNEIGVDEPAADEAAATQETASEDAPAAEDQSESVRSPRSVRLVAFQDDEPANDESTNKDSKDDDGNEVTEEKMTSPSTDEAGSTDNDASPGDAAKDSASKPEAKPSAAETNESESADESDDSAKPAGEGKASEAESDEAASDSQSAMADDASEPSAESTSATGKATEGPQYQPFEAVRDQVAESIAGPRARQAMDAAMTEANNIMRKYFTEFALWGGGNDDPDFEPTSPEPERPDLQAVADRLGMEYRSIALMNEVEIAEEPIASSVEMASQMSRQPVPFTLLMYGVPAQDLPPRPKFSPLQTVDFAGQSGFVTWKTEDRDAYTPELDEVREEVIEAIRQDEARELARAEAEKIASQLSGDTTLDALVPEDKLPNFNENVGPFTWLNSFGQFGVSIGNVRELNDVGEEFMRSVFSKDEASAGVGPNRAKDVYYVFVVKSFEPSMEELREQFRQPINRRMAASIGTGAPEIQRSFQQSLEDRLERAEVQ